MDGDVYLGKSAVGTDQLTGLASKTSLHGLNLRSGFVVNLAETKTLSYTSLTVNWIWGG